MDRNTFYIIVAIVMIVFGIISVLITFSAIRPGISLRQYLMRIIPGLLSIAFSMLGFHAPPEIENLYAQKHDLEEKLNASLLLHNAISNDLKNDIDTFNSNIENSLPHKIQPFGFLIFRSYDEFYIDISNIHVTDEIYYYNPA